MRLRRSNTSGRDYRRVRAGAGFSYRAPDGSTVQDPELRARIAAIGIPPAWTDVWIAPYDNGHIQAVGTDTVGRKQYLYHPGRREKKDRVKFDRALALAESLPSARRQVTMHLRRDALDRERVLATAFWMLDTGSLRVGSERYAEANGSHGLTTLLCAHVRTRGDTVEPRFPARSHQSWESDITDPDLAAVVRLLKRRGPTARLLAWRDPAARAWPPVQAAEVNEYVRERTGGAFSAKDFRTLHGTLAAAVRAASEVLGKTPSIARASYVDPRRIDAYDTGETIDPTRLHAAEVELRALLHS